jgi:RNA polymerase sigma factor (sigma-70 family)
MNENQTKLTENQKSLITQNLGLAYWIANKWEYKQDILDKEELISEALYGLTKAAIRFDAKKGKFSTYAKISIDSDIIDALRARKRKNLVTNTVELTDVIENKETSYTYENIDVLLDINTSLSNMKSIHKSIFEDFYIKGFTQEEIGRKNNMSQPNVYKILKKVVKEIAA